MTFFLAFLLGLADPRVGELAAVIAGRAYDVDPALLLSIAFHESRYQANVVTAEEGGKVSCGVMTPIPMRACPRPTVLGGYLAGAAHLRVWLDVCGGHRRCAELGYAGGFRLLRFCAAGGEGRGCAVPGVFEKRARAIRGGLS